MVQFIGRQSIWPLCVNRAGADICIPAQVLQNQMPFMCSADVATSIQLVRWKEATPSLRIYLGENRYYGTKELTIVVLASSSGPSGTHLHHTGQIENEEKKLFDLQ